MRAVKNQKRILVKKRINGIDVRFTARVAEWIRTTPLDGYVGCSAAIPAIDVTFRLRKIDIPCLVMVGADDIAMPLTMAQTLARGLQRAGPVP